MRLVFSTLKRILVGSKEIKHCFFFLVLFSPQGRPGSDSNGMAQSDGRTVRGSEEGLPDRKQQQMQLLCFRFATRKKVKRRFILQFQVNIALFMGNVYEHLFLGQEIPFHLNMFYVYMLL